MTCHKLLKPLVMCIQKNMVDASIYGQGFLECNKSSIFSFLPHNSTWFGPREELEFNEAFLQIVPYVILRDKELTAIYRRSRKFTLESRLAGLVSMGFGGHAELSDARFVDGNFDIESTLRAAAEREVNEEIWHGELIEKKTAGILSLSQTPVDKVHLGIVEMWHLPSSSVFPKEQSIEELKWIPAYDLPTYLNTMENWSAECLKYLF